jgi:plasmid stabilization system protein ParE
VSWEVLFTTLAEDDVAAAYGWYATSRGGLGDEFLADLEGVVEMIGQFPEACPAVHRELRRALLHRFPYSVYYRLMPAAAIVEVRGCVHQRRHPRTWRRRA